jgi:hypothetical protein
MKGKKTYMTAVSACLVAVGTWLGDPDLMPLSTMLQICVSALLACFLRTGIKSDTTNVKPG